MITIIKPGLLTSLQDLGRFGFQKYGIVAGGAMDPFAHRIANLLVGNKEDLATLEITLIGPTIHFHEDTLIAICGGQLSPSINGIPIHSWRPILVEKDSELKFGHCLTGCRAYLAVAGGFSAPKVMRSRSTYLRAELGGFHGRTLNGGDQLLFDPPSVQSKKMISYFKQHLRSDFFEAQWSVASTLIPLHRKDASVHVMKGQQFHLFSKQSKDAFFHTVYEVSTESDRMGYRLKGQTVSLEKAEEMISSAVNYGTIQVPPDGNPIILLADRQTTGGYPKIGQIATFDRSVVAQVKPGDYLRFTEISHEDAQLLLLEKERKLQQLKQGIKLKFM